MKNFIEKHRPILNLEKVRVDGEKNYSGGPLSAICEFPIYITKR